MKITTILYSQYPLEFTSDFCVMEVKSKSELIENLFYNNALYILDEKTYSRSNVLDIRKFSKNALIVYVYEDCLISERCVDQYIIASEFSSSKLNIGKIKIDENKSFRYNGIKDRSSATIEEYIRASYSDYSPMTLSELDYLESWNVCYHHNGILYFDLKSLSKKIYNKYPSVHSIMLENELPFSEPSESISIDTNSSPHMLFEDIPYQIFEKLYMKLSRVVEQDHNYDNFIQGDNFSFYWNDDKLYLLTDEIEKTPWVLEYLRCVVNNFFPFETSLVSDKVRNFDSINGKHIWLIARINGNRYFKFFVNQCYSFNDDIFSVDAILESAEEIYYVKTDYRFMSLIGNFPSNPAIDHIAGQKILSFEWISCSTTEPYNSNLIAYSDILGNKKYFYPGTKIIKQNIDREYIKKFCQQVSYDEKQNKCVVRINFMAPGEYGKTTLIHKIITDKFYPRQFGMTDGIEYTEWNIDEENTVFFTDFGGAYLVLNLSQFFIRDGDIQIIMRTEKHAFDKDLTKFYNELLEKYAPSSKKYFISSNREYSEYKDSGTIISDVKDLGFLDFIPEDCEKNYNIDVVRNLILTELKNRQISIPKSYELIAEKIKRLNKFVLEENEFIDMIEHVDNKENFCNYLYSIGMYMKYKNFIVIDERSFYHELIKIFTVITGRKFLDVKFLDIEEFRKQFKESNFLISFMISNKIAFEKEGVIHFPSKYLDKYFRDNSIKNNDDNIIFKIGSFENINLSFINLICTFSDCLEIDELRRNSFVINFEDHKIIIEQRVGYITIHDPKFNVRIISKVLQIILNILRGYFSSTFLNKLKGNLFIGGYEIPGCGMYVLTQNDIEHYTRDTNFNIGMLNVFSSFYNKTIIDGRYVFPEGSYPIDITNDYVNLERIIPENKILFLVYDGKKVPVSKYKDIFDPWLLGDAYDLTGNEVLEEITQEQRNVLEAFLRKNLSNYTHFILDDGYNSDLYIPFKNIFGRTDYIFKDVPEHELKGMIEEEKINFFNDIAVNIQQDIIHTNSIKELQSISKNLLIEMEDIPSILNDYENKINELKKEKNVKNYKQKLLKYLDEILNGKQEEGYKIDTETFLAFEKRIIASGSISLLNKISNSILIEIGEDPNILNRYENRINELKNEGDLRVYIEKLLECVNGILLIENQIIISELIFCKQRIDTAKNIRDLNKICNIFLSQIEDNSYLLKKYETKLKDLKYIKYFDIYKEKLTEYIDEILAM